MIIKRVLSAFVFIIILISVSTAVNAASPYSDVSEKFWGYEDVLWASECGLMVGTSGDKFSPNADMTRAMLTAVLWRYEGEPIAEPCSFTDVKRDFWYTESIDWAAQNGIVYGMTDTSFSPNGNITREQLVTILYRYASTLNINVSGRNDLSDFADSGKVGEWSREAMQWAVAEELVQGITKDGVLCISPRGNATRAQVAAVLHRFDILVTCNYGTEHTEELIPGIEATCESSGLTAGYRCSKCNTVFLERTEVPALGHDYYLEEIVFPTCIEEGHNYYICQNDPSHTKTDVIDKTEHIPGGAEEDIAFRKESTCVQKGYTDIVVNCIMCGYELERERTEMPLAEHTPGEVEADPWKITEPTCTEDGSYEAVRYCVLCTEEISREVVVIPVLGHNYYAEVTAPGCIERGFTTYICQNEGCTNEYVSSYVNALGHDERIDEGIAPECEKSGISEGKHCERCGEILVMQYPMSAVGHDYVGVLVKLPGCVEAGIVKFTCRHNAAHTYTEERAAIGHDMTEYAAKEPTCTKAGWESYQACTRCTLSTYNEIPPKGHTLSVIPSVEPECEKTGLSEGRGCTACGEIVVAQKNLPALGHDYQVSEGIAPTCTSEGYDVYTCTHDNEHTYTVVLKIVDHSYEAVVTPPTETLQGYTTHTCIWCGRFYVDSFVPPIGYGKRY